MIWRWQLRSRRRRRSLRHRRAQVAHALRTGVVLAVVAAFLVPVGMGIARLRLDGSINAFVPAGDPSVRAIKDKAKAFGGDPVVVLLESKDDRSLLIDADQLPKLATLEGKLARVPNVAAVYGPGTVVNQIASGARGLLAEIAGRRAAIEQSVAEEKKRSGLSDAKAEALRKKLLGQFDARYGSLLVAGMPAGLPTVYNPAFVQAIIFDADGSPKRQWRFVVPSPTSVAVVVRPRQGLGEAERQALADRVGKLTETSGLKATRTTVSGVPVVTSALAQTVRTTAPWLAGLALLGCGLALVALPRVGAWWRRLMPVAIMSLAGAVVLSVMGWVGAPVSIGVLVLFPILLGIGADFPMYLTQGVRRRRVLTSGLASAAAASCLAISPLPVIRELGLALAGGILVVIALSLFLGRWLRASPAENDAEGEIGRPRRRPMRGGGVVLSGLAVLVAVAGWAMLPQLQVRADPERLAAGLSALDDAEHVEEVIGASAELSVMLRGENVLSPEALAWERAATDRLVSRHGDRLITVTNSVDLLGFLGQEPTAEQVRAAVDLMPPYLTSAVATSDRSQAVMIFGTDMDDVAAQSRLLDDVRADLPKPPEGYQVELVGTPVAAARAYQVVSADRYLTTGVGILAAGVVLLIGLRRIDAVRAVAAGVLATGWGLALLWAVGGSLTPLTVALGSLTTVVGCEFLVMLTGLGAGSRRTVRRAVVAACANSCAAYLVLTAARIEMLREFGLIMATSVVLALAAASFVVRVSAVPLPSIAPSYLLGPSRRLAPKEMS